MENSSGSRKTTFPSAGEISSKPVFLGRSQQRFYLTSSVKIFWGPIFFFIALRSMGNVPKVYHVHHRGQPSEGLHRIPAQALPGIEVSRAIISSPPRTGALICLSPALSLVTFKATHTGDTRYSTNRSCSLKKKKKKSKNQTTPKESVDQLQQLLTQFQTSTISNKNCLIKHNVDPQFLGFPSPIRSS